MRVLIIEDEAPAFRRLQTVLEEVSPHANIVDVIDTVAESIKWFQNHKAPDIVFMDIQLSDGISFEIFDQARIECPVIFTTAFDEYMLRAFKVNSIDYLLKPIKKEELALSMQKYNAMKNIFSSSLKANLGDLVKQIRLDDRQFKSRFLVKVGDTLISVETGDIAYFQTRHGVVHLVNREGRKYLIDVTMEELVQQLDPQAFFRANRQFIVHFDAIEKTHRYHKGKLLLELMPATEEQIIVSSEKSTAFKQWLGGG